jgi:alkylation response protein AidB-like acyl-CoA dehydrogenase
MTLIWEPMLSKEAQRWRAVAERVTREQFAPLAEEIDRKQRYPRENVRALVELGLAGLFIPKEYGGQGADLFTTATVVEAIATGCASTGAILCTYQLGAFPILLAGRADQKRRYLADMTKGVATSFALSERAAGSDAAAIETSATREGDGWRLRGEKYWIGNGGASRHYVVFAKTDEGAGGRGISAFMVASEEPGVVIDELADKMGLRGTGGRAQPRPAACLCHARCRAGAGRCAIARSRARRLSRGVPARGRTPRVRATDH